MSTRAQLAQAPYTGQVFMQSWPRDTRSDETQTAQTIALMCQLAREDSTHPLLRQAAHQAIADLPPTAGAADRARAVWQFVRSRVRFRDDVQAAAPVSKDPAGDEVLTRPVDLLTMPAWDSSVRHPAEDCDGYSTLTAALLRALGIEAAFVTVAAERERPAEYSHVYVLAQTEDGPLSLDTSHGPYAGWSVKAAGKLRVWPIDTSKERQQMQSALGSYDETTGTYMPDDYPTGSGGSGSSGFDWSKYVDIAAATGSKIALAQWGQPNIPTGTYMQTGPNGTVMMRQQPGSAALQFPSSSVGGNGLLLILAAVAVVGVFAFTSGGKH